MEEGERGALITTLFTKKLIRGPVRADLAWELMNNLNVDDDSALEEVFALLEIYTVKLNGVCFAYSRKCDRVCERPLVELLQTSTKHITVQLRFVFSKLCTCCRENTRMSKAISLPSYLESPPNCKDYFESWSPKVMTIMGLFRQKIKQILAA